MSFASIIYSALVLLVLQFDTAEAHGALIEPSPTFTGDATIFVAAPDGTKFYPTYKAYDGWSDVDTNADKFNELMKASAQYPTLKSIIDSEVPGCGNTDQNAAPVDVSSLSNVAKVQNIGNPAEGLTRSHSGPCEFYIDDQLVFQDDNCAKTFTASPAEIPMDYSSCNGNCMFTFYWVGLQEQNIQLYKNCVPLSGGNGNANAGDYSAAPAVAPVAPAPVAAAPTPVPTPAQTTAGDYGAAPAVAPVAPAPVAAAPTPAPTPAQTTAGDYGPAPAVAPVAPAPVAVQTPAPSPVVVQAPAPAQPIVPGTTVTASSCSRSHRS